MFDKNEAPGSSPVTGQMNMIFRARMLWRDLATWMTIYLVSLYGGYPNQSAISQKLYDLPLEYGNFLKFIFGDGTAEEAIHHLSSYIITLQNLFYAQKIGDAAAAEEFAKQLYQIMDDTAEFFARINPYWQEETWRSLLYNYNKLLLEDSLTLLTEEYEKNIDVFDRILSFSSVAGDYFFEGIINYLNHTGNPPLKEMC
ncbi:MAG TPA: hypothetical protein PKA19_09760 [Bacillota bacterium]|nr:hypothetical protein [Bacillota bacterium]